MIQGEAKTMNISRQDIEEIAESMADKIFRRQMLVLGYDVSDPTHVLHAQADFAWLRKARRGSDDVARIARKSALGIIISAVIFFVASAVWQSIKAKLGIG